MPNDFTKRYDDSTKLFAFLNGPVIIDSLPAAPVMLYAYNEYKSTGNNDNFGQPPPTSNNRKKQGDTLKVIKFATNLQSGRQDLLDNLVISFAAPLATFDSSKISFTDTNFHAISNYKIVADTSLKNFTLQYPWKENQYFKLIIQKDAFIDSTGKTLAKTDTIKFQTAAESEYGSIRLQFPTLDFSKNPVLQITQSNKILDSIALTSSLFYRKLYKPGDYELPHFIWMKTKTLHGHPATLH